MEKVINCHKKENQIFGQEKEDLKGKFENL